MKEKKPTSLLQCFNAARLLKESKVHNIHRESKEQVKKGKKKKLGNQRKVAHHTYPEQQSQTNANEDLHSTSTLDNWYDRW